MSMTGPTDQRTTRAGERGAITLFFVLLVAALLGAIGLSIYVGQLVERRMRVQIAADEAAMASAAQAAQGLNMISANNLAIATSIHVAGGVQIAAMYFGVAKAAMYGVEDYLNDLARVFVDGSDQIQEKVFDRFAIIGGTFMNAASGMTVLNGFINRFWLVTGSVRSLEIVRLNLPGAVAMPLQKTTGVPNAIMKYEGLRQVTPANTICHAIKASEALDRTERNNPMTWIMAPMETMGTNPLEWTGQKVKDAIDAVNKVLGLYFGFVDCGPGLTGPLWDFFTSLASVGSDAAMKVVLETEIGTFNDAFDTVVPSTDEAKEKCCEKKDTSHEECGPLGIGCAIKHSFEWGMCNLGGQEVKVEVEHDACLALRNGNYVLDGAFGGDTKTKLARIIASKTLRMMAKRNDGRGPNDPPECLPFFNKTTNKPDCFNPKKTADKRWICPLQSLVGPDAICGGIISGCFKDAWREKMPDCTGWQEFESSDKASGTPFLSWGKQAEEFVAPHTFNPGAVMNLVPLFGNAFGNKVKSWFTTWGITDAIDTITGGGKLNKDRQQGLGFLVIVTQPGDTATYSPEFDASRHFVTMVTNPVRTTRDFSPGADCPTAVRNGMTLSDGSVKQGCDDVPVVAFGVDLATATPSAADPAAPLKQPATTGTLSGGIQPALKDGWLKHSWARMQILTGQSQVVFEPAPGGAAPKAVSQLFWPAWRPRPAKFSMMSDLISYMRNSGGSAPTSAMQTSQVLE